MAFVPKYKPMTEDQSRLLLAILIAERKGNFGEEIPDSELPTGSMIVKKRIDVLNLPMTYTKSGLFAVNAFCNNPGQVVVLLIDFLRKYEGQQMTAEKLSELYPFGFYDNESFDYIVDNIIKPDRERSVKEYKWSDLY